MRDLLPASVAVAVAAGGDWVAPLPPGEQALLVPGTPPARRRDFTAGRTCARRALAALGMPGVAVLAGADHRPCWPAGVVGSITHAGGYCAAVAARRDRVRSVGIDAEPAVPLDPGVEELVCLPGERRWCAARRDGTPWSVVVFSAKEAVYKLWSQLVGTWLDFHDVRLRLNPLDGSFEAVVFPGRSLVADRTAVSSMRVPGRFRVDQGLVRTAAVLVDDTHPAGMPPC